MRHFVTGRLALLALLLLLVVRCQPLPQPFADDRPPPGAPILTPKDGAGIIVRPIAGLSESASAGLAEAMADALQSNDIPASTLVHNRASYVLTGQAHDQALDGDRTAIDLRWELHGPDGASVGTHDQKLEVNQAAWRAGNPLLLADLAKSAAPSVAELLQEEGAIDAGSGGPNVLVRQVAGAPGDGPRALARAMAASLRQANVAVTEKEPTAETAAKLYVVAGTVTMAAAGEGKQKVTVSWELFDPSGAQVGHVSQENAVPAGSLNGHWGDIAYAVANAAAGGIVALLEHLKVLPARS
ncbi:MAG: hypothetical protein JO255_06495 [Alphaproteobacteria bacterium]|nr:hypothetical protein [Alphaproteobacteria bacterium]